MHKILNLEQKRREELEQLKIIIEEVRANHPTMCIRDMYYKIKPIFIGRDKFEAYCKQTGFMLKRKIKYCITTDSSGVKRFPNLINNIILTKINQVWQSDITYFEVNDKFYYITFIIDAYSRRIIGYCVSDNLMTEYTTLPALKMAIKNRKDSSLQGLILHSDGGGQYYANTFFKLTSSAGIINSMCKQAYENGKAERLNGVIKNNYLIHWQIDSYNKLVKMVDHAVLMYNLEKPHIKLKRKTPIEFENNLLNLHWEKTATMTKSIDANVTNTLLFEGVEPSNKQGKKLLKI